MIDWLRREPREVPEIALGERRLPVVVVRHPRARRMTLRLAPSGDAVRVTLPQWGRTAEALAFARSRAEWLAAQLDKVPLADPPRAGGTVPYRGEPLAIHWAADAPRGPRLADGAIAIGGPQRHLVTRLARWLEKEGLRLMQSDLADFCAAAGVPQPALRLSRARRRWGSCASDGTVRINWRLVMAPDAVRRSVVAHEVAHLLHFDHGPAFKAALGRIYDDDLSAADRWLKDRGRTLYAPFG
ncbi:M48 family metallopeptidase [Pelagerythrobacter marensis]|uniref:Putative metal-dependent hydrolase n=1 Tax=Pelagerythrobacter marensis TaxID=543877 RepID=A0A0G3X9L7_9SPHN|nr:YgjP-like metallopeptidase domain-containing protein [Pelagerythrobacter marensis]AKM07902.1 Putative metal-dependent hydrolase [Pelagerythrobacter marensis]